METIFFQFSYTIFIYNFAGETSSSKGILHSCYRRSISLLVKTDLTSARRNCFPGQKNSFFIFCLLLLLEMVFWSAGNVFPMDYFFLVSKNSSFLWCKMFFFIQSLNSATEKCYRVQRKSALKLKPACLVKTIIIHVLSVPDRGT